MQDDFLYAARGQQMGLPWMAGRCVVWQKTGVFGAGLVED